jgi:predicted phosphodiesterase
LRSRYLIAALAVLVSAGLLTAGLWAHALLGRMGCLELPRDAVSTGLPGPADGVARFVALGDTGTGSPAQLRTARVAKRVCRRKGCGFAVLLGDNFYPHGMKPHDERQFRRLILRPYAALHVPIFAVLGNHDLDQNPIHQVRASRRHRQWRMPNFRYQFRSGPAQFYAVNSNCGALEWWRLSHAVRKEPDVWNFVLAHHPAYSQGPHGDSNWLDRGVWQWLVESKIDVMLSGHDHNLEHLQKEGAAPEYFVLGSSGGNSEKKLTPSPSQAKRLFHSKSPGFAWLEVSARNLHVEIYDDEGSLIYTYDKQR